MNGATHQANLLGEPVGKQGRAMRRPGLNLTAQCCLMPRLQNLGQPINAQFGRRRPPGVRNRLSKHRIPGQAMQCSDQAFDVSG
ncbi:MAG: hypothetical protein ACRD0I_01925, partial [Acidimicrobiales bacterium]